MKSIQFILQKSSSSSSGTFCFIAGFLLAIWSKLFFKKVLFKGSSIDTYLLSLIFVNALYLGMLEVVLEFENFTYLLLHTY